MATGTVTYHACFHDLPMGLQTHVYAPLGTDIKSKWSIGGSLPGEPRMPAELGLNIPKSGLYLREDIDLRASFMMSRFVRKTLQSAHATLVDRLLEKNSLKERNRSNALLSIGGGSQRDSAGSSNPSPHLSTASSHMAFDPAARHSSIPQPHAGPSHAAGGAVSPAFTPAASDAGSVRSLSTYGPWTALGSPQYPPRHPSYTGDGGGGDPVMGGTSVDGRPPQYDSLGISAGLGGNVPVPGLVPAPLNPNGPPARGSAAYSMKSDSTASAPSPDLDRQHQQAQQQQQQRGGQSPGYHPYNPAQYHQHQHQHQHGYQYGAQGHPHHPPHYRGQPAEMDAGRPISEAPGHVPPGWDGEKGGRREESREREGRRGERERERDREREGKGRREREEWEVWQKEKKEGPVELPG